jgi:hypothetical protein
MTEYGRCGRAIVCMDFADRPGFPGCCDSCHDDANLGYGDNLDCALPGTTVAARLCCRVLGWLDALGETAGPGGAPGEGA